MKIIGAMTPGSLLFQGKSNLFSLGCTASYIDTQDLFK